MSAISHLKYNDTESYIHMTVLNAEGVFCANHIRKDTLPEGFYHYELSRGSSIRFSSIQEKPCSKYAGDFITREKLILNEDGRKALAEGDWVLHEDHPFDFEAFWGHKISFEKLVSDAERTRDLLMGKDTPPLNKQNPELMSPIPERRINS